MSESENIERVVRALEKVPSKELLIIELVNRFTKDGQLDNDALADAQPEVNVAVAEAKMYGAHTIRAVSTLELLEAIPDVGSERNSTPE